MWSISQISDQVSDEELRLLIRNGLVRRGTLIRNAEETSWKPAASYANLSDQFGSRFSIPNAAALTSVLVFVSGLVVSGIVDFKSANQDPAITNQTDLSLEQVLARLQPQIVRADTIAGIKRVCFRMPLNGEVICRFGDSSLPPPSCDLCEQLTNAQAAFNHPETMRYNKAEELEFVIAPPGANIAAMDAISDEAIGPRIALPTQYSLQMVAFLRGDGFSITPSEPQSRTVLPNQITKWTWSVKPQDYGDMRLTLEWSAMLRDGGRDLAPSPVQIQRVTLPVEVGIVDRLVLASSKVTILQIAVTGVGGLVVAIFAWLWKQFAKKKQAEQIKVILQLERGRQKRQDTTV